MSVRLDGVRMVIVSSDIDKDGIAGGIERIESHKEEGVMQLKESSELGEALEQQNKDVENEQRLSSVDFISRLNNFQVSPISAVEYISSQGVISGDGRKITRIIKRNVVSIDGKGREEFVNVAVGKREMDARKAGFQNMTGVQNVK